LREGGGGKGRDGGLALVDETAWRSLQGRCPPARPRAPARRPTYLAGRPVAPVSPASQSAQAELYLTRSSRVMRLSMRVSSNQVWLGAKQEGSVQVTRPAADVNPSPDRGVPTWNSRRPKAQLSRRRARPLSASSPTSSPLHPKPDTCNSTHSLSTAPSLCTLDSSPRLLRSPSVCRIHRHGSSPARSPRSESQTCP
jgi:hypothetical protein